MADSRKPDEPTIDDLLALGDEIDPEGAKELREVLELAEEVMAGKARDTVALTLNAPDKLVSVIWKKHEPAFKEVVADALAMVKAGSAKLLLDDMTAWGVYVPGYAIHLRTEGKTQWEALGLARAALVLHPSLKHMIPMVEEPYQGFSCTVRCFADPAAARSWLLGP